MKLITGNNFSSGTEGKIIWKILVGHYGINYMVCVHLARGMLCPYVVTADQSQPSKCRKNSGKGNINSIWRKEQLICEYRAWLLYYVLPVIRRERTQLRTFMYP